MGGLRARREPQAARSQAARSQAARRSGSARSHALTVFFFSFKFCSQLFARWQQIHVAADHAAYPGKGEVLLVWMIRLIVEDSELDDLGGDLKEPMPTMVSCPPACAPSLTCLPARPQQRGPSVHTPRPTTERRFQNTSPPRSQSSIRAQAVQHGAGCRCRDCQHAAGCECWDCRAGPFHKRQRHGDRNAQIHRGRCVQGCRCRDCSGY